MRSIEQIEMDILDTMAAATSGKLSEGAAAVIIIELQLEIINQLKKAA